MRSKVAVAVSESEGELEAESRGGEVNEEDILMAFLVRVEGMGQGIPRKLYGIQIYERI